MNAADLARRTNIRRDSPYQQEPMNQRLHDKNAVLPNDRSRELHLIHEALARAQMEQQIREAEIERRAYHIRMARRMRRRAEVASLRARRALAIAVM